MRTATMSFPSTTRRLLGLLVGSLICRVAQAQTTLLNTNCYDMEGKRIRYLTWQNPTTCPADSAQHSWKVEPRNCGGTNSKGRIVYECEDFPGGLGSVTSHTTGCQQVRNALIWLGIKQLSVFNVDCPSGTVMTEWNMVDASCSTSFRQIQYQCATPAEGTTTLTCGNYQTSCEPIRDFEDLEYLEPLPIACPASRPFLNRWQLTDSGCASTHRRFTYNCCEANVPEPPPTTQPPPQSGGAGGDPHFKLWSGTSYDFHGHCDLLLVKSSSFANGTGLDIHIRSSPYREVFSYISEAAVRIGDTVLWIGPGGEHSINSVPQQIGKTQAIRVNDHLEYPVTSSVTKRGRFVFKIRIGNGDKEEIILRQYNNWITVNIMNPTEAHFQTSQGLLGRFPDGALLGRDGSSVHSNYIDFGNDWVIDSANEEHLLSEPNPCPGKCHLPSIEKGRTQRRRLGQSQVTVEQAQKACAHWGAQMDNCISDVILLEDLAIAEDGPL